MAWFLHFKNKKTTALFDDIKILGNNVAIKQYFQ